MRLFKLQPFMLGIPDRVLISPRHPAVFVELKRGKGAQLSAVQRVRISELVTLQLQVAVIDDFADFELLVRRVADGPTVSYD